MSISGSSFANDEHKEVAQLNHFLAMQSLQTMSKAPTQPANLPPLQNLPSWTRNSLLRKKQPRQIIRDHLEPINPVVEEMDNSRALTKSNDKSSYSGRIVSALLQGQGLDQEQRIEHVEKTIDYLRTEHAETLSHLHKEIERLKAENKGELKNDLCQILFASADYCYYHFIMNIKFHLVAQTVSIIQTRIFKMITMIIPASGRAEEYC